VFNLTATFEKTPGALTSPPPTLSEHTDAVLAELGYEPDDIAKLRESGVV
jgi:alpha-methylacyl-CoA racemase